MDSISKIRKESRSLVVARAMEIGPAVLKMVTEYFLVVAHLFYRISSMI